MEDRYTSFTAIQLAGEESFIRWVLFDEHDDQWHAWLTKQPALQNTVDEAQYIVTSLSADPSYTLIESDKKELWKKIDSSVQAPIHLHAQKNISAFWKWGLAAAATLALLVWINMLMTPDTLYADLGEHKVLELKENSVVNLNAGTSLSYQSKSFENERTIHLEGEAFFNVTPGSTFTVKTDFGSVTVLGTSFNVLARDGRFEVNCYSGTVQVETPQKVQSIITQGEKATLQSADQTLTKSAFIFEEGSPDWMAGRFIFEDQPLHVVLDELERQFNIKVELDPSIEQMKYTGLFESGDLEQALKLITWPLHLESKTEGNTITIYR